MKEASHGGRGKKRRRGLWPYVRIHTLAVPCARYPYNFTVVGSIIRKISVVELVGHPIVFLRDEEAPAVQISRTIPMTLVWHQPRYRSSFPMTVPRRREKRVPDNVSSHLAAGSAQSEVASDS
jgi:hypothetical protein